jgi:hypothetical protein
VSWVCNLFSSVFFVASEEGKAATATEAVIKAYSSDRVNFQSVYPADVYMCVGVWA